MNLKIVSWKLVAILVLSLVAACDDSSEPRTTHRSLADAASQLRSSATVDTTPRGHVLWNGSARILLSSDCALRGDQFVLAAQGDGVSLRLVYLFEDAVPPRAFGTSQLQSIELRLDTETLSGALFRVEPESATEAQVTTTRDLTYGALRLDSANEAARKAHAAGVLAEFEFRCS